jgi:hypothetical protein
MGILDIFEHEFFDSINFDTLNEMEPVFKPSMTDINTMDLKSIGDFPNSKECEKVELSQADQELYNNCNHVDIPSYEAEIVEFLMYEDVVVGICIYVFIYLFAYVICMYMYVCMCV